MRFFLMQKSRRCALIIPGLFVNNRPRPARGEATAAAWPGYVRGGDGDGETDDMAFDIYKIL